MNKYTFEDFESLIGKPFEIEFNDAQSEACQLVEAKESVSVKGSFSLIFESTNTEIFEQAIYAVKNTQMGDMELFLVPVNGDDKGVQYEAIFT